MRAETIMRKIKEHLPKGKEWVIENLQYLTLMGSHAYGTNRTDSDWDVYGFTIPSLEYILPFTGDQYSFISGYDVLPHPRFNQEKGEIKEGAPNEHIEYQIYSISKYFKLVEENNPNMIDSLFTRDNCVLYSTPIGDRVRANRKLFLHKGCWHKFRGYAHSQLRKATRPADAKQNEFRKELIRKFGYDTKFAVHLYRLLDEVEQILSTGDVDLMRNREQHKQVLNGFYTYPEVEQFFKDREKQLHEAYTNSELPYTPDKEAIRGLLVECIDEYWHGKGTW